MIPSPTSTRITRVNWLQTSMMFLASFVACLLAITCLYFFLKWRAKNGNAIDQVDEPLLSVEPKAKVPVAKSERKPDLNYQPEEKEELNADDEREQVQEPNGTSTTTTPDSNAQPVVTSTNSRPNNYNVRAPGGRFVKQTR